MLQKFLTAVMLEIGIALVANCVVITWAAKGEPPSEFVKKMLSFKYLRNLCSCKNKDEVVKISSQENGQVHINGTSFDYSILGHENRRALRNLFSTFGSLFDASHTIVSK